MHCAHRTARSAWLRLVVGDGVGAVVPPTEATSLPSSGLVQAASRGMRRAAIRSLGLVIMEAVHQRTGNATVTSCVTPVICAVAETGAEEGGACGYW